MKKKKRYVKALRGEHFLHSELSLEILLIFCQVTKDDSLNLARNMKIL